METKTLEKSDYIRDCIKFHFLSEHGKNNKQQSLDSQLLFDQSEEVHHLVRRLYAGGIDAKDYADANSITIEEASLKFISDNQPGIYYNLALTSITENLHSEFDIVILSIAGSRVIEIKSSTRIKEPQHIDDVAFQWRVLQSFKTLQKSQMIICTLNKNYILKGVLNLEGILDFKDVTRNAKDNQPEVDKRIRLIRNAINVNVTPIVPIVEVGSHCERPYACVFQNFCFKKLGRTSIIKIKSLSQGQKEFYLSRGIKHANEIPGDAPLTEDQKLEIDSAIEGKKRINKQWIKKYLKKFNSKGPVAFLDFETESHPIPKYQECHPYQRIPFQYCLLYRNSTSSSIIRREFLAITGRDPRKSFILNLINDLELTSGAILVYYEKFEKLILGELKRDFPEYRKAIDGIISRIVDLSEPFSEKKYYHPSFEGRYSLKKIIPVICPSIKYEKLKINNGRLAMYHYSLLSTMKGSARDSTIRDLREYCYTDVLSMVKILDVLNQI